MYCFEIFTNDVSHIEFMLNNRKIKLLNIIRFCSKLFTVCVRRFLKYIFTFIFHCLLEAQMDGV